MVLENQMVDAHFLVVLASERIEFGATRKTAEYCQLIYTREWS